MKIADRNIGINHPPFIIAEMSGNHNQSIETALRIVDAAAAAGATAIKLQTYTADTMTIKSSQNDFIVMDEKSLWSGESLYDLYDKAHTPWAWHKIIFDRAQCHGMLAFSTPFDESSVDFLESLNVPCYKIASFENTDLKLIKKVASTQKPVIISTGMASISELDDLVSVMRSVGNHNFILLKCTSSYPSEPRYSNIRTIPHLRELFKCEVGLSDHTMGIGAAMAAVALGATIVEKHFTLSRAEGGVDAAFSLEPQEFSLLVSEASRCWISLGEVKYGPQSDDEIKSKNYRRSLYFIKKVYKGDVISSEVIKSIRPGFGLPTKYYEVIIGRTASRDILPGTPVSWELLS
jgi:pseudaminic acid synthase